ncbi:AbrB/MazE/SpoVT family DNA-binding domain-containing protein [Sphingomonas sp.]|jgi:antitoxin MazE|uniref:AbrB/MazE/SpoVT family DNA-binding domain-containing protein n=1 Tax=Sphingomonas sp. TaxID=28214 RepID=UPI002ED8D97F
MQVAKWGNSLAVRIPADVARLLDLKEGDNIDLCALDGGQIAVITDQQRRAEALKRLSDLAVTFPADYKFDRDDANAR